MAAEHSESTRGALAIASTKPSIMPFRIFTITIFLLLLLAHQASSVWAVDLAIYDFHNPASQGSIDTDLASHASDVTLGTFAAGSGSNGFSSTFFHLFIRSTTTGADNSVNTLADAIASQAYASFTLDPLASSTNIGALSFDHFTTNGGSATDSYSVALMSSMSGFNLGKELDVFHRTGPGDAVVTHGIDLTPTASLQGLTIPVEFRLYFFDNVTGPVHRLDNIQLSTLSVTSPFPCDLDADGDCDLVDLQDLYATSPSLAEILSWLADASDPLNPSKTDPADTYVLGDANLDGNVNSTDLGLVLNNFGSLAGPGWGGGDLTGDEIVDSADLGLVLNNFNFPSNFAATTIPEPDKRVFVLLLSLPCLKIRRWYQRFPPA